MVVRLNGKGIVGMKIMNTTSVLGLAFGAAMLWSAPAQANLNCPSGSEEYNGQCWSPNPSQPPSNVTATGGNSSSTATANGTGTAMIGDVGGGTATTGPINVNTGPNTSASGVTGSGNSDVRNNVTNRNDIANTNQQGQQQGQTQQARANNTIRIDNSNRTRQAAAQAAASGLAVCNGEYGQASFSTALVGMNITKCKLDRFEQVIYAEELWHTQGRTAGAIYLADKDNGANRWARSQGITETSQDQRERWTYERETRTQTRFAAPEHTGSTPMVFRQQRAPQAVQCPADYPVFNPATGKCRK